MDLQLWYIVGMGAVAHILLTVATVSLVLIVYDRWLRHSKAVPLLGITVVAVIFLLLLLFYTVNMWRF